jgi:hypothetical protein
MKFSSFSGTETVFGEGLAADTDGQSVGTATGALGPHTTEPPASRPATHVTRIAT